MRKTSLIALISFALGLFAAAIIFVYFPDGKTQETSMEESSLSSLSSSLYASPSPQVKPNLDFATVAQKISPSVVSIVAEKVEKRAATNFFESSPLDEFWERFFGHPRDREQEYRSRAQGTGFFITSDGYILTNNHIVEKAVRVTVTSIQEREYKAKIIGTDPETDLALLKVESSNLPFIELGNSDALKVGEWVLAIGNPMGFTHTVTAGIVSAKGRLIPGLELPYQDFIQTDAAINRGNSGGPLVNMSGEVVGINSMIWTPTGGNIGIGFAISSKLAKDIIEQLKETGRVIRGYIGVTISTVTEDMMKLLNLKSRRGALINSVVPDLPADKAGLKRYDVIVAIDGDPVKDNTDLLFKIAATKPGTKVKFSVMRDGKEQIIEVKVTEKDSDTEREPATSSGKELGIRARELTPSLARRYGYRTEEGLIITEIKAYSEAELRGLEVGDIILEANKNKIRSIRDFEKIVKDTEPGDAILLLIRREGRRRDTEPQDFLVTLRVPE